ncbi:MAG: 5-formyltetrahydrofolate cyclo-ligase [Clostridia bacterium]
MTKQEARKHSRERLKNLTLDKKIVASVKITYLLKSEIENLNAKKIFIFLSDGNEPNTIDMIEKLLSQGYEISVPVVKGRKMIASKIDSLENLKQNEFGILEPTVICREKKFDVCVAPLLAFDENLSRCGRGKGFYDKFLKRKSVVKIGIAFDCQKVENLEMTRRDVQLDKIITEEKIYKGKE